MEARRIRWGVRMIPALITVFMICAYSTLKHPSSQMKNDIHTTKKLELQREPGSHDNLQLSLSMEGSDAQWITGRHLMSSSKDSENTDDSDDGIENCTRPRNHHEGYSNTCHFVHEQCQNEKQLINYLAFVLCDFKDVQPLGYALLTFWLLYLISLLASTATSILLGDESSILHVDYFFVPPLNLLATKLKLSPSIAGITLLAVGNGAPDIFTAFAALQKDKGGDEMALVLSALIGASLFISTVVLGTIILFVKITSKSIDKLDYIRDVTAYIVVVGIIIAVSLDGTVHLSEAIVFPLLYFVYIATVVVLSYVRRKCAERQRRKKAQHSETVPLLDQDVTAKNKDSVVQSTTTSVSTEEQNKTEGKKERLVLLGLTWPRESHIGVKIQWLVEWPFSLMRWLSIPHCYHDGQWSEWHHWFVVISPVPMALVLLVSATGWDGFSEVYLGKLPLYGFLLIISAALSAILFFILRPDRPPNWFLQSIFSVAAFVMSIAWLNIVANEIVTLLETFGLLFDINTAILGLTVLAIGNSVSDWVADVAVSRAGSPGMGVASCIGAPLLTNVLGLSVALIVRIVFYDGGKTYTFPIHSSEFSQVKLSWIFLGISLLSSAVVIPVFKFIPPKAYGVALIYLYIVFVVFSVLDEVGVLNLDLSR